MYGTHFYFASLRKLTAVFGNMFANLQIQRTDGTTSKLIDVPISFAPKEAFLIKLNEVARNTSEINTQMTLPRMSFEITGMQYDAERKLDSLRYLRTDDVIVNKYFRQYNAVPYMVNYELNIYTVYIDDMLQVIEQIVPNFTPSVNIKIKEMPLMNAERDVPFTLEAVTPQMDLEGAFPDAERAVNWTLSFSAQSWLYPPIKSVPVIKKVIENIIANDNEKIDAIITTSVDPFDADITDNWSIVQTTEEF